MYSHFSESLITMEIATQQLQYRDKLYNLSKAAVIFIYLIVKTRWLAPLGQEASRHKNCLTTLASVNHLIPSRTQK